MRSAKWICKCDLRWSQKIQLSSSLLESSTSMGAAVDIPSVSRCGSIPATLGKRLACRAMDRSFQPETTQNISIRDNWQMMFETAAIGMMMMMMMMMMMRTVLSVHQSVLCPSHCHISPIVFFGNFCHRLVRFLC